MIKTAKRLPVVRYGLIVSLILILSFSAFYLYFHYTKAVTVRYNFSKLIQARGNSELIDSCIINLFKADNNSRMYALTKDKLYFRRFSENIKLVSTAIQKFDQQTPAAASMLHQDIDGLLIQKTRSIKDHLKVLELTDSLLRNGQKMSEMVHKNESKVFQSLLIRKIAEKIKKDTLSSNVMRKAPERKFFSRVFSAMSKKKTAEQEKAAYKKSIVDLQRKLDSIIRHTAFADDALRENNKKYQDLLQANNTFKNNELQLITINNELINRIVNDLNNFKLEEQKYITDSHVLLDENLQKVVYDYKRMSGMLIVLLSVLVTVVLYNIWKLFKNDRDLITSSETAEMNANSKSAFLANMSHEIRTPLNSVIGFSEQLMTGELNAVQSEQVKAISNSSTMLLSIVNEILDFSKYETGKMKLEAAIFSPHTAITDVVLSMGIIAQKKGLILKQELDFSDQDCVSGDQVRLKQVILNLLNNAIKFTNEGTVLVKAWTADLHDGFLTLNVQVKDSGIGISKDNLRSIFDDFSQVEAAQKKSGQKGTGLGLAISRKIIELQGGQISVSSEEGVGSTFSFQLKYKNAHSMSKAMADNSSVENSSVNELAVHPVNHAAGNPVAELTGKHMLVADDNELNILLVSTILKKWNITYDIALDGIQALDLVDKNNYDVILTDIEMPNMGGIELSMHIRNLQNQKASIPILALTANVLQEDTVKYMDAGMNGIIIKPFSEWDMMHQVAQVFSSPSAVKPEPCADQ